MKQTIAVLALATCAALPAMADMEYVDMGTSVLWATTNYGAQTAKDLGNMYAWGMKTTETYTETTYPFYDAAQGRIVLPELEISGNQEYDIVAAETQGVARTPGKAEWDELLANCNVSVVSFPSVTITITSKTTGNSIKLPGSGMYNYYYQTASASSDKQSYYMCFSEYNGSRLMNNSMPYKSYMIRPVREKSFAALESITVTSSKSEIFVNTVCQVSAEPVPASASLKELTWTSSNPEVAAVDADGNVLGVADGTVTITGAVGDITASVDITVKSVDQTCMEFVDMGSGVLWCVRDFQAESYTANGTPYAFGVLSADEYGDNYPYYSAAQLRCWLPAENICGVTEYDVIANTTNQDNRLPSESEWEALKKVCVSKITEIDGVKGVQFTSNVTGHWLFFPLSPNGVYKTYVTGTANSELKRYKSMLIRQFDDIEKACLMEESPGNNAYWLRAVKDKEDTPVPTSVQISVNQDYVYVDNYIYFKASCEPQNATLKGATWTSSDPEVAEVSGAGRVYGKSEGTATITYSCGEATASKEITVKEIELTLEPVDMGDGTMWASHNYGAANAWDTGDYYSWGYTQPGETWEAPTPEMRLDICETEYDAVYMNSKGAGRLPKKAEMTYLIDRGNTTAENVFLNGNYGVLITSKENQHTMFLPGYQYLIQNLTNKQYNWYYYTGERSSFNDPAASYLWGSSSSSYGIRAAQPIRFVWIDMSVGIDGISAEESAPAEYYNLNGIKVQNPGPGLYIVRQGITTEKVLIK